MQDMCRGQLDCLVFANMYDFFHLAVPASLAWLHSLHAMNILYLNGVQICLAAH